MKTVLRWLTRDRFAWSDVGILTPVIVIVVNSPLPWLAGIAVCIGAGLVTGAITIVLQRAAGTRPKRGGAV